jgi:6-pyruvoyltetrahydropterin/6-carboxytetrahydropterin synthase
MFRIGKRFSFDAAHVLHGLPAEHKCGRLHGHTYTVEIELSATGLAGPGFVVDFAELAAFGQYVKDVFDHRLLNDVLNVEPTSERLAEHFYDWCRDRLPAPAAAAMVAVRVSETPSTWAEYSPSPEPARPDASIS